MSLSQNLPIYITIFPQTSKMKTFMNRFIIITIVLFSHSFFIFGAKNTTEIKGSVIDNKTKVAIAFATVSVHHSDSTIVSGATSGEDGSFIIKSIPFGEYFLKVSFIGYKDVVFPLVLDKSELNIGEIALEEDAQMLASAVVSEKRAIIEQKLDKLVMNVSELVSTQGSNAVDILRKAPGISVDPNGNITLNGSVVDVWIDGRPSYLSGKELEAMLLSTDGNTIEKIEIIAHPSAKYDASGSGGIINIKTKKNFVKGFNGSLSATYGGMYFDNYLNEANGTVNLGYRSEKSNTFFTYSPRYEQMSVNIKSNTFFGEDNKMKQISDSDLKFDEMSHSLKLGNDFFINKKNIFGFIVTSLMRDQDDYTYGDSFTDTYLNDAIIYRQKSDINNKSTFDNISGNLNYTHIFNEKKGSEMTVNADYAYYDLFSGSHQENIYVDPLTKATLPDPNIFTSDSRQYINMYSAKLDYEQMFWKTGKLELGGKWSMTNTDNNTLRKDFINDVWVKDNNLSSVFVYNEQVAALYATAAKMFGQKWVVKLGLRGEYTISKGDWISAQDYTKKTYFDLFPTVYAGYTPSEKFRYSLSYSMRIRRPGFSQMNPQRQYVDANSSIQGNPSLNPQYSDNLNFTFGFKSFLNISLVYVHTRSLIMQTPMIDEQTGEKVLYWDNFGSQNMAGANVSVTELPIFKWWVVNASIFGAYNTNNDHSGNYSNNGFMMNGYGNFTFLLPKEWKVEFGAWYQSALPWGYFRAHPQYSFFGGVKKNLFDGKATLALNVNDIFRTSAAKLDVVTNGVKTYTIDQTFNSQKISLSFSYRFGTAKQSRQRNVGEMDDASRVGGGSSIGK
jgi:iron complex outermembrane recepter protein